MCSEAPFSTLIVTYNNCSTILQLLTDIYEQAPPPVNQLIVIDNASLDNTTSLINNHFPDVHVIPNPVNIGFGRAVNQGFALCNSQHFFLINPDIRLTDPTFYSCMIECIERSPSIAAIGPIQFKKSRDQLKLNFTWSYLNPRAFHLYLSSKVRGSSPVQSPIKVSFLNAGCLLIRSSAFKEVGKLNEMYFMYGEEPDLFYKFKEHNFTCLLHPSIHVVHFREHSFMTLSLRSRIVLKFSAIFNISHALLCGWKRILRKNWVRFLVGAY